MSIATSTTAQLIQESQAIIKEGLQLLTAEGKTINLNHWITLKRYAEKYEIDSTSRISNWITRGIIPAEDVIQLEELNGLKLIKDRLYKELD